MRPGLLGDHGVNIATMSPSRHQAGGTALTVLNRDTAPDEALRAEIRGSEDVKSDSVRSSALQSLVQLWVKTVLFCEDFHVAL